MSGNDSRLRSCQVQLLSLSSSSQQIVERVLCGKGLMASFQKRNFEISIISNGNRTEWSPIRSVIIRVITKSDDRAAGVRFVYHEYDYRQNWTTQSLITN